jgi:hypothetical protein
MHLPFTPKRGPWGQSRQEEFIISAVLGLNPRPRQRDHASGRRRSSGGHENSVIVASPR